MKDRTNINLLRASIISIILPVLYIGLWIKISGDDFLTYNEQVMTLMGYFPEFARDPFWLTVVFLGMSVLSATLSFRAWLRSVKKGVQISALMVCSLATLLTIWFASTLL